MRTELWKEGSMTGKATAPLILCGLLASCGSFRPEEDQGRWREIRWTPGYPEARARALEEDKPILLILVSGDLEADC
jgi:hypothetical protein